MPVIIHNTNPYSSDYNPIRFRNKGNIAYSASEAINIHTQFRLVDYFSGRSFYSFRNKNCLI